MQEERDKLKEKLLHKKEPRRDDVRKSHLIQIVEDNKIRTFTGRNTRSKEKAKVWLANALQMLWEKLKDTIFPHTENSLTSLPLINPSNHLGRSQG